jgi:hypothetical protein
MAAWMWEALAMVLISHMVPAFSASTKSCAWPSRSRLATWYQPGPVVFGVEAAHDHAAHGRPSSRSSAGSLAQTTLSS